MSRDAVSECVLERENAPGVITEHIKLKGPVRTIQSNSQVMKQ